MGRCQSTPGLVESSGRTTCEDMWLPSTGISHSQHFKQLQEQQQHAGGLSSRSTHGYGERTVRSYVDSPGSMSPSASDEQPHRRVTSNLPMRPQSQPSRTGYICDSSSHLECYGGGTVSGGDGTTPLLGSHEALEDEIKRLRERLHTVESENQALNTKLSQQQWDLENRLAEIEMQICGVSSTSSLDPEVETDEIERNRESII